MEQTHQLCYRVSLALLDIFILCLSRSVILLLIVAALIAVVVRPVITLLR